MSEYKKFTDREKMTVKDLREYLNKFDDNMFVCIQCPYPYANTCQIVEYDEVRVVDASNRIESMFGWSCFDLNDKGPSPTKILLLGQ